MKHPRICLAALVMAIASVSSTLSAQDVTFVQQRIADGVLEGVVSGDGKVRTFKGIPYAAPPVGNLRWQPPQPVEPWQGVRQATEYPPRAMQGHIWDDMFFYDDGPSEDCLYLNLWLPEKRDTEKKLPVMFWIHGGGFIAGSTSEPRQDAGNLSKKGVLVVSVTYRMGVFGFMAHPELTAESPHHASGNYGLLDMVAALEWVRDNIENFGGDPDNVTIFGESAGSMAVSSLMASPLAKGLFHKAIGESGAAFSPWRPLPSRESAEETAVAFAKSAFGTSSLEALRALPAEELLEVYWKDALRDFRPIVDGYFLPEAASKIFAAGGQSRVPLLAGWNLDEGGVDGFLDGAEPTVANYAARAQTVFGDQAPQFLEAYSATNPQEVERAAADYSGDRFIGYGTWKWLETHVATGTSPIYRYRFDQLLPLPADAKEDAEARAAHSWEIEYVFRVISSKNLPWRAEDWEVSELMSSYWTNFAKTGNPNGTDLPNWPLYNGAGFAHPVMHIDATPTVESDTHRARFEFLETLPAD